MQAEWVIEAPMGDKRTDKFVGIISVNEWNGKPIHTFAANKNGDIGLMQETNFFFRKVSMRNSYTCHTMDYTYVEIKQDQNGIYPIVTGYSRTYCLKDFIGVYTTIFEVPDESEWDLRRGAYNGYYNGLPYNDYEKIKDCAGIVGGTAKFSEKCQTCIGGTTGIEKCPSDSLKKIMKTKNDCLTEPQNTKLNNTFNQYLNTEIEIMDCYRQYIYKKIEASGLKIGVCLKDTLNYPAVYRSNEKNLLFKDESMLINSGLFEHEFFHVFQDA